MKIKSSHDLQNLVFHKVWTETKERSAMSGRRKLSKADLHFGTSMALATDLVKILNADSDEVAEIISSINKKYNNKEIA
tara:strand:- start:2927 stop:3163 length:237 start_codon:yes stop_codon:yes gene_type:complete